MTLNEHLVSAPEAGKILGLTTVRVGVLCREGRFDGAAKIGRNWVIPRVSVENFRRLPPGAKSRTKKQHGEDKAMIARVSEATQSGKNAEIAGSDE